MFDTSSAIYWTMQEVPTFVLPGIEQNIGVTSQTCDCCDFPLYLPDVGLSNLLFFFGEALDK
jgi:hypothetical protein